MGVGRAKHTRQRLENGAGIVPCQGIVDRLGRAPRLYQRIAPKPGQMLRQRRLAEPNKFLELADAVLLSYKVAQNKQAVLIAHRLQQHARDGGLFLELFHLHCEPLVETHRTSSRLGESAEGKSAGAERPNAGHEARRLAPPSDSSESP